MIEDYVFNKGDIITITLATHICRDKHNDVIAKTEYIGKYIREDKNFLVIKIDDNIVKLDKLDIIKYGLFTDLYKDINKLALTQDVIVKIDNCGIDDIIRLIELVNSNIESVICKDKTIKFRAIKEKDSKVIKYIKKLMRGFRNEI